MRLIKQRKLHFQDGQSDKIYEVDLCEAGENEFVVNFRYGRRGTTLRDGTKTVFPVSLEEAEKVYERLVNSKLNKGYQDVGQATESTSQSSSAPEDNAPTEGLIPGNPTLRAKIVEYLKKAADGRESDRWKLSRVIWRAGELRMPEAVEPLLSLAQSAHDRPGMDRYALGWALGRCGKGEQVRRALNHLAESAAGDQSVRRMALEGLRVAAPDSNQAELVNALPEKIKVALETGEADTLRDAIHSALETEEPPFEFLHQLYLLAHSHPAAREAVFRIASAVPFKPPFFKHIRHLFKAAEFRLDAEFFGMLARRFETANAYYRSSSWGGHVWLPDSYESVDPSSESKKKDSRLAYSSRTRRYLRKRVVSTLERAAETNDVEAFITLATGVLMAYQDERDQREAKIETEYRYVRQSNGRYQFTEYLKHFDEFADYHPLNYLLYKNSPRYRQTPALRWICKEGYKPGEPAPDAREEAYPKLWDLAPDALMHILSFGECGRVIEFAVKVWRANGNTFNDIPETPFVAQLLRRPYEAANALGLELAQARFDPDHPDRELLNALLDCDHEPARKTGMEFLSRCKGILADDLDLCASLITSRFPDIQIAVRRLVTSASFNDAQLEELLPRVFAFLQSLDSENGAAGEIARNARETILIIASHKLTGISDQVVMDLLGHELEEVQLLAANIALQHKGDAGALADEVLETLLLSSHAAVREIGMQIFGSLSDSDLLRRQDILASFCISKKADLRTAAHPIVERLAKINSEFAQEMVTRFYPALLRKEAYEGLHRDIYALLEGPLGRHLGEIPVEHGFRMLDSRYVEAQKLGLLLIRDFADLKEQPMREIARMGGLELQALREFIIKFYRENPDFIKANKEDALRILDIGWQESRESAFAYFRETFVESDWTPSLLVSICDSVRPDVQALGRELITKFFKTEDGPEYLLKLSQHPNPELQTFATNYLERFAGGNIERITKLELFFVTVLSQVNRGRVAKDRVLSFLGKEAAGCREAAEVVTRILKRQSATMAIGDKASCIETLLSIQKQWPELGSESPLVRNNYAACEID